MDLIGAIGRSARAASHTVRLTVVAVLCLATCLLFGGGFRHQPVSVISAGFAPEGRWTVGGSVARDRFDPATLSLLGTSARRPSFVTAYFPVPAGAELVRMSGEFRAEALRSGYRRFHQARVLLLARDRGGVPIRHLPRAVGGFDGTTGWTSGDVVVPVADGVATLQPIIANGAVAGTLYVRNLLIEVVEESSLFVTLKWSLLGLWAAAAFWFALAFAATVSWRRRAMPVCAAAGLILVAMLTPQPYLSYAVSPIEHVLDRVVDSAVAFVSHAVAGDLPPPAAAVNAPPRNSRPAGRSDSAVARAAPQSEPAAAVRRTPDPPDADADAIPGGAQNGATAVRVRLKQALMLLVPLAHGESLAHFGVFFILAAIGGFYVSPSDRGRSFTYAVAFAVSTEVLQLYYYTRGLQLADLIMNLTGLGAGAAMFGIAARTPWVRACRPA